MDDARERPFLAAVVDPEVALVWSEALGPALERLAAAQPERLRRKMLRAREQLREAGRQWVEGMTVDRVLDDVVDVAPTMSVAEASAVLGVTEQHVRRLARGGVLAGSQQGRVWTLEAWSVRACAVDREDSRSA